MSSLNLGIRIIELDIRGHELWAGRRWLNGLLGYSFWVEAVEVLDAGDGRIVVRQERTRGGLHCGHCGGWLVKANLSLVGWGRNAHNQGVRKYLIAN